MQIYRNVQIVRRRRRRSFFASLIIRGNHINRSIWTCRRRSNDLWQDAMIVWRYEEWAPGTVPERVRLCIHTKDPTGPVPEPFHCNHIARWSARSGTTGRSGTGVNTGNCNGSGTVLVPNLWCEQGLLEVKLCLTVQL